MLYQAILYTSKYPQPGERHEVRRFGTQRAAELWAESVLPPIQVTRWTYHRDVGRAPSVRIEVVRRPGKPYGFLSWVMSPAVVVPSVGELGWTP